MDFDYRLSLMCGTDIPFPDAQLVIHQPTLEEIALIGEKDFFQAIQTLGLYKTMFNLDESVLEKVSNFQIFMMIMTQKETADKKYSVEQLFSLILPNHTVNFTPSSIIFIEQGKEPTFLDESNFEKFQILIRSMFGIDFDNMDSLTFNPVNEKAREIADKIIDGRRRIAELKGVDHVSIFSQYMSILVIGIHMSILEISKMTTYQLYDLIERYNLWLAWDVDLRAKLAGSTDKRQPENWMKNIH